MPYKNIYQENLYLFGWIESHDKGVTWKKTTGGNSEWAKNKSRAIKQVNDRQKASEKEHPNHVWLRVDEDSMRRAKTKEEADEFSYGLYLMTI